MAHGQIPWRAWKRALKTSDVGSEGAERVADLREDSEAKYKDDYTINKALRRQLRYVSLAISELPSSACFLDGYTGR